MTQVVALTGATGFIGHHLVTHFLELGWSVRALTRRSSTTTANERVCWVQGALEDENALNELCRHSDVVVHCAGAIKAQNKAAFFETNVTGTKKVVAAAERAGVARFIYLSSLAAREPLLSAYAASKRAAEEVLQNTKGDLVWTILRPPAVYGPGDRETFKIMQVMARGIALAPGTISNRLSFIHQADLCRAICACIASDNTHGKVLELRDPGTPGYNWTEISEAASAALGVRVRPVSIPRFVVGPIAHINEVIASITRRPAMLTSGKVNEMYHADWSVPENVLTTLSDWRPQISLADGFQETFRWYKEEGWL